MDQPDGARIALRRLMDWHENSWEENVALTCIAAFLVLFAGCMSGLTLGLLSLDHVGLEVLKRSGSPNERRYAAKIIPVVKHTHFLLVTLLLCNACAMEALPIVLDKMFHEAVAIMISVTVVLFFGEIFPQSICSKHGLYIGSVMVVPVRILMVLTSPISWPIAKLLDMFLGHEQPSLFKRNQLKTLVKLHSTQEHFGGRLTADETQIITGALDLSTKTAFRAMTQMRNVFMLSTNQKLDEQTIQSIMAAKPFTRVPVYRDSDRSDVVGMVLVTDLLDYSRNHVNAPVANLSLRPIPRLPATTPLYDILKLFRSGKSHMAILTQPHENEWCLPSAKPLLTPKAGMENSIAESPTFDRDSIASCPEAVHRPTTAPHERTHAKASSIFAKLFRGQEQNGQAGSLELKQHSPRRNGKKDLNYPLNTNSVGLHSTGSGELDVEVAPVSASLVVAPGDPIGIITFEDVMEELFQFEILDETDRFMDNECTIAVKDAGENLPQPLQVALALAEATKSLFQRTKNNPHGSGPSLQRLSPPVPPTSGASDPYFYNHHQLASGHSGLGPASGGSPTYGQVRAKTPSHARGAFTPTVASTLNSPPVTTRMDLEDAVAPLGSARAGDRKVTRRSSAGGQQGRSMDNTLAGGGASANFEQDAGQVGGMFMARLQQQQQQQQGQSEPGGASDVQQPSVTVDHGNPIAMTSAFGSTNSMAPPGADGDGKQ